MSYELHNFAAGQRLSAASLNEMDQAILNVTNASGNNNIAFVNSIEELKNTTTPYVCIFDGESEYGSNGLRFFTTRENETRNGTTRNDGSIVFPVAQSRIPEKSEQNVPKEQIMSVIKSWVGKENFEHIEENMLFSENCVVNSNGNFNLDCSSFVSAVIQGISYDNSRYVLGTNAENKRFEYSTIFPQSKVSVTSKGGMTTWELAQWFAENGRLYNLPLENRDELGDYLQFGDVVFLSNYDNDYYNTYKDRYMAISHCAIVLGTVPHQDIVIVAQCSSAASRFEPTVSHLYLWSTKNDNRFVAFGRPFYLNNPVYNGQKKANASFGKYELDGNDLLPCTEIIQTTGVLTGSYKTSSTAKYYPIHVGDTVKYTGEYTSTIAPTTDQYIVKYSIYDENFTFLSSAILQYQGSNTVRTITDARAKYIRFVFGLTSASSRNIYLADLDNFKIEITNDSMKTIDAYTKEESDRKFITEVLVDDELLSNSDNPIQNKAVYAEVNKLKEENKTIKTLIYELRDMLLAGNKDDAVGLLDEFTLGNSIIG